MTFNGAGGPEVEKGDPCLTCVVFKGGKLSSSKITLIFKVQLGQGAISSPIYLCIYVQWYRENVYNVMLSVWYDVIYYVNMHKCIRCIACLSNV